MSFNKVATFIPYHLKQ